MVRVIRDVRDARLDYFLPRRTAKDLYNQGKLAYDCTNLCYCE